MDPARKVDGRVERGDRTRQQILDAAVDIASVEGLEGLSIGRLALKLEMSKSGLFAAFGSKQDLQLATVDHAAGIFVEQVVRRAMAAPRGLPRLWSLCESKLEYMQREVFRGGCFFAAAWAEFDGRAGPVRDRIAGHTLAWVELLPGAGRRRPRCACLAAAPPPGCAPPSAPPGRSPRRWPAAGRSAPSATRHAWKRAPPRCSRRATAST